MDETRINKKGIDKKQNKRRQANNEKGKKNREGMKLDKR